jgi:hypothetical protein
MGRISGDSEPKKSCAAAGAQKKTGGSFPTRLLCLEDYSGLKAP